VLYAGIFIYIGLASIGGNIYLKNQRIKNGVIGGKDFGVEHQVIQMEFGIIQVGVVQIWGVKGVVTTWDNACV